MSLNTSNNTQNNAKIQSFLESLRASRGNQPKSDQVENQLNPFKEVQQKKEIEKARIEHFHQARQREWNNLYSSKEKEVVQKIESIRQQLKSLAVQMKRLDQNLYKAVEKPILSAGVYHESYLEHIQKSIRLFSLHVNSTNSWLEMYNQRSTKKGFYHSMAKSRGSSFTQANERTIATSVG